MSDRAWLAALLEAERALANAEAIAGVIPPDAAAAIADRCRPELFDAARSWKPAASAANPVEPLVRELAAAVGGEAAAFVHWRRHEPGHHGLRGDARLAAGRSGSSAPGSTPPQRAARSWRARTARRSMAGRTLLQHAVPDDVRAEVRRLAGRR